MPMLTIKPFSETILELPKSGEDLERWNHVFEPEYHQDRYVEACRRAAVAEGAFQLGDNKITQRYPFRGVQPVYADIEEDPESLEFEGMLDDNGNVLDDGDGLRNVCALKSNVVRKGYLDFGVARSVSRAFYEKRKLRSGILRNDILINSTGDGTIGRVAVYNEDFPSVVDGHITIVRCIDPALAWYIAAYLLSQDGQDQIFRYINGSSGQVEIYPQDIARLWIPPKPRAEMEHIGAMLRSACLKHKDFFSDMKAALAMF